MADRANRCSPMENPDDDCNCLHGYVRDKGGMCVACISGKYADTQSNKCNSCSKNTFSPALSSKCFQCPQHSTSMSEAYSCKCDANYYTVNAHDPFTMTCQPCPIGTTSEPGSRKCSCPPGTRETGVGKSIKCYRCPPGKFSSSGSLLCTSKCVGNTYNAPDIAVVDEMPLTGICRPCPAKSKAVDIGNNTFSCKCNEGLVAKYSKYGGFVNDSNSRLNCVSITVAENSSLFVGREESLLALVTLISILVGYFVFRR